VIRLPYIFREGTPGRGAYHKRQVNAKTNSHGINELNKPSPIGELTIDPINCAKATPAMGLPRRANTYIIVEPQPPKMGITIIPSQLQSSQYAK
jgi:hypothetical protein